MTRFARLASAALAATSVAALATSAANAAVTIRPTISVTPVRPTITVAPVRPTISVAPVRPTVAVTPVRTAITVAPVRPVIPSPGATHAPTLPVTHAPVPGVPLPAHHVAIPPNPTSSVAAELGGKPVIKVSYAKGNELTVYYLSPDAQHVVGVVSGISAPASTPPATHVPPPTPPVVTGKKVTFTPVSYPEITDALGRPMGYVNAQGQAVYFPNGQMPQGFTVGPNHKIDTYVMSTSTPSPASKPAPAPPPAPQHPASSKPAVHSVTFTPVSYPEITDAYGAPMGYVDHGLPVYFPNGHMPMGFSLGPNHTIETYKKS
jgi:hypothetical protein